LNPLFLSVLIANPALTFSFGYDVEVIRFFALGDQYFFGLTHHEFNFLDQEFSNLDFLAKQGVAPESAIKDESCHVFFKGGRN